MTDEEARQEDAAKVRVTVEAAIRRGDVSMPIVPEGWSGQDRADMIIGMYHERPLVDTPEMRLIIRKERGNAPERS